MKHFFPGAIVKPSGKTEYRFRFVRVFCEGSYLCRAGSKFPVYHHLKEVRCERCRSSLHYTRECKALGARLDYT